MRATAPDVRDAEGQLPAPAEESYRPWPVPVNRTDRNPAERRRSRGTFAPHPAPIAGQDWPSVRRGARRTTARVAGTARVPGNRAGRRAAKGERMQGLRRLTRAAMRLAAR